MMRTNLAGQDLSVLQEPHEMWTRDVQKLGDLPCRELFVGIVDADGPPTARSERSRNKAPAAPPGSEMVTSPSTLRTGRTSVHDTQIQRDLYLVHGLRVVVPGCRDLDGRSTHGHARRSPFHLSIQGARLHRHCYRPAGHLDLRSQQKPPNFTYNSHLRRRVSRAMSSDIYSKRWPLGPL